jgi:hypothetical protein
MLTMRPCPWAFMTGATALVRRIGPGQVDSHDLVPYLQRQIVEIAERDRDVVGGVIDQDIEAAEGLVTSPTSRSTAAPSVMSQPKAGR